MSAPLHTSRSERVERWLWTGPIGHLAGGTLDVLEALARHLLARARGSTAR
jgi:hypothetical protein